MPRYMIEWALDTEADDPQHAVRIALSNLQLVINDPSLGANTFVVSEVGKDDTAKFITADNAFPEEEVDVWAFFQKP